MDLGAALDLRGPRDVPAAPHAAADRAGSRGGDRGRGAACRRRGGGVRAQRAHRAAAAARDGPRGGDVGRHRGYRPHRASPARVRPARRARLQAVPQPVLPLAGQRAGAAADPLQPPRRARGPAGRSADPRRPDPARGRLDRGLLAGDPGTPDRAGARDPAAWKRRVQRHAFAPDAGPTVASPSSAPRVPRPPQRGEGVPRRDRRRRAARRSLVRPRGRRRR